MARWFIVLAILALAATGCGTSGSPAASPARAPRTSKLQQALDDYSANKVALARSEFLQVVRDDPKDKYGWYNLAVLAQSDKNSTEAQANYVRALAIDPNFEPALYNFGVNRFNANDVPTAIIYLSKAVIARPQDANAHWDLGIALAQSGTPESTLRSSVEMNAALKLNPSLITTLGGSASPGR